MWSSFFYRFFLSNPGDKHHFCWGSPARNAQRALPNADGGGGFRWLMCFSGKNLVDVQGKGLIPMDSLSIGDYVKTADGSFSRVYSFYHIDRKTESVFLQMFATGLAQPLEIFRDHYLYVGRKLVRAGDVKVGDELDERSTFTAIKTVKRRGYYNPLTESGDIVV